MAADKWRLMSVFLSGNIKGVWRRVIDIGIFRIWFKFRLNLKDLNQIPSYPTMALARRSVQITCYAVRCVSVLHHVNRHYNKNKEIHTRKKKAFLCRAIYAGLVFELYI
jgi:hypothetical protein